MRRTILVHLNIEVESAVEASEVGDLILAAIEVGSDSDEFRAVQAITVACTLAEEV